MVIKEDIYVFDGSQIITAMLMGKYLLNIVRTGILTTYESLYRVYCEYMDSINISADRGNLRSVQIVTDGTDRQTIGKKSILQFNVKQSVVKKTFHSQLCVVEDKKVTFSLSYLEYL